MSATKKPSPDCERGASVLPSRLSLFGHTRLASTDIELLEALATHHELHLWLPHPSDALWRTLRGRDGLNGIVPRRADTSHREVDHPLLATLGRDLRELQRSLPGEPRDRRGARWPRATRTPCSGWLQSDLAANTVRPRGSRAGGR